MGFEKYVFFLFLFLKFIPWNISQKVVLKRYLFFFFFFFSKITSFIVHADINQTGFIHFKKGFLELTHMLTNTIKKKIWIGALSFLNEATHNE